MSYTIASILFLFSSLPLTAHIYPSAYTLSLHDALPSSERDEEIAGLRADVAFYERLVGSTSQRKGLNTHSIEFSPESAGT